MVKTIDSIITGIRNDPIACSVLSEKKETAIYKPDITDIVQSGPSIYKEFEKGNKAMQKLVYHIDYQHSSLSGKIKYLVFSLLGTEQKLPLDKAFQKMTRDLKMQASLVAKRRDLCIQLEEALDSYYERVLDRQQLAEEESIRAENEIDSFKRHISDIEASLPYARDKYAEKKQMLLLKRKLRRNLADATVALATSCIIRHDSAYQLSVMDSISENIMAVKIYIESFRTRAELVAEHIDQTIKVYKAMMEYLKEGIITEAKVRKAQAAYERVTEMTAGLMELPIGRVQEAMRLFPSQYRTEEIASSSANLAKYAIEENQKKSRMR